MNKSISSTAFFGGDIDDLHRNLTKRQRLELRKLLSKKSNLDSDDSSVEGEEEVKENIKSNYKKNKMMTSEKMTIKLLPKLPSATDIVAQIPSISVDFPSVLRLVQALNASPMTKKNEQDIEEIKKIWQYKQENRADKREKKRVDENEDEDDGDDDDDDRKLARVEDTKKEKEKNSKLKKAKAELTNFLLVKFCIVVIITSTTNR